MAETCSTWAQVVRDISISVVAVGGSAVAGYFAWQQAKVNRQVTKDAQKREDAARLEQPPE